MKIFTLFFLMLLLNACVNTPIEEPANKTPNSCELKPKAGMCRAAFPRFYYDHKSKECKQFIWGGCGGVVPFKTLESCQQKCEN